MIHDLLCGRYIFKINYKLTDDIPKDLDLAAKVSMCPLENIRDTCSIRLLTLFSFELIFKCNSSNFKLKNYMISHMDSHTLSAVLVFMYFPAPSSEYDKRSYWKSNHFTYCL